LIEKIALFENIHLYSQKPADDGTMDNMATPPVSLNHPVILKFYFKMHKICM